MTKNMTMEKLKITLDTTEVIKKLEDLEKNIMRLNELMNELRKTSDNASKSMQDFIQARKNNS